MAQRELVRQSAGIPVPTTFGVNLTPSLVDNWSTEATETYNPLLPATAPSSWGTALEIANLDRRFDAVGSEKQHNGILLSFAGSDTKPDRTFYGAEIKVRVTYLIATTPKLELWTRLSGVWTLRRRVSIAAFVRSGDTIVVDLTYFPPDTALAANRPDAIWITLDTTGTTGLFWIACHLFGDCALDSILPPCPVGTPPEDCNAPECGVDPTTWLCDDDPKDPRDTGTLVIPPILVKLPNDTNYVFNSSANPAIGGWYNPVCPGPKGFHMLFGQIPASGSVTVTVANAYGTTFVEGVSQTISAPGTMTWTVAEGFRPVNAANPGGYIPPAKLIPTTDFFFGVKLNLATAAQLLEMLTYYWTSEIFRIEVC